MRTEEQIKALKEKALARVIEELEIPQSLYDALVRLRRTTIRGLTVLRQCDLFDALDADPSISEAVKNAGVADLRFILNEMGLELNPEGRFESFATLIRCTKAAAQELGLRTEEKEKQPDGWGPTITIHLRKPKGSVRIRELENLEKGTWTPVVPSLEVYDPDFTTRKATDRGMVIVRQLMRRAEEIAADEE